MKTRRRSVSRAAMAAIGVLALAGFLIARSSTSPPAASRDRAIEDNMLEGGGAQPIGGVPTSVAEAAASLGRPIPLLSSTPLVDVCTGESTVLTLVTAWNGAQPGIPPNARQAGLTYTHGITVAIDTREGYADNGKPELPPAPTYGKPGQPGAGWEDSVRGHVAWAHEAEGDGTDACPSNQDPSSAPSPGPFGASSATDSVLAGVEGFPGHDLSVVTWAERGVVVHLAGPYPVQTLEQLAAGVSWTLPRNPHSER